MSDYGVKTVVGGWNRGMTDELLIPWTLARTQIEHAHLGYIFNIHLDIVEPNNFAVEFGCGYGRNLHFLNKHYPNIIGIERDAKLSAIASDIWRVVPTIHVVNQQLFDPPGPKFSVALTYTVLQHIVDDVECKSVVDNIQNTSIEGAIFFICEETDTHIRADEVKGRSVQQYESMFDQCFLIEVYDRQTLGGHTTAKIMVFRRGP